MRFEIVFHTPFRVASGQAGDGSDTTIDPGTPLPASSLKGLMRSAARDLLVLPGSWVDRVFGAVWHESPWSWSDAVVTARHGGSPELRARARVRIDLATSTVTTGALLIADEVLAARAEFTVDQTGWIEPARIATHQVVLLAAARAVTAVGGDRRRGLGWVSVHPAEPRWSPEHLEAVVELIQRGEPAGTGSEGNG